MPILLISSHACPTEDIFLSKFCHFFFLIIIHTQDLVLGLYNGQLGYGLVKNNMTCSSGCTAIELVIELIPT